ncbi:hypothetical protein COBT_003713, partial [Conglomerata obtusa]
MQGNNEEILNKLLIADLWMRSGRVRCLSGFFAVDRAQVTSILYDFGIVMSIMSEELDDQIGGDDIIVETDESKFGKRKYNRGHKVLGAWVVGLVERTS